MINGPTWCIHYTNDRYVEISRSIDSKELTADAPSMPTQLKAIRLFALAGTTNEALVAFFPHTKSTASEL